MDIRHLFNRAVYICCGFLLTYASCEKNIGRNCAENIYSFELPFLATPDTDSISLGQSIDFVVNSPNRLIDKISGENVEYAGTENLGSAVFFIKYDSTEMKWKPAASQHSYILQKGREVKPVDTSLYREYIFVEENSKYLFALSIVPKSPGLYGLVFGNASNVYRNSDPCTKASFTINLVGSSHNRYLDGDFNEVTPGGDFYFHVSP